MREKESKQRHPSGEDAKHTKGGGDGSQDGETKDHPQHPKVSTKYHLYCSRPLLDG